ncbi:MAG: alcohol dehydrogenase catalytic domain-containing protein [Chloroherpetonaceae bacterium]|nr:alcohol dehydrogenase catalytic domain-containing protein [Chloroherpetonaceae bacterium]
MPKAILYPKLSRIILEELELVPLGKNHIRVRTIATSAAPGVERLLLTGKSITRKEFRFPVVTGSELIGEIIECGEDVNEFQNGDYVFLWKTEGYKNSKFPVITPIFGCQCAEVIASTQNVVKLLRTPKPEDILIGLLAFAISASEIIPHTAEQEILILGLGSVGLMMTDYLNHLNLKKIDAAEKFINRGSLSKARQIALDLTDFPESYFGKYDLIIEASGRLLLVEESMKYLKTRGKVLLLGNYDIMKLDYRLMQEKEPSLILTHIPSKHHYELASTLIGEGIISVERFMTSVLSAYDPENSLEIALNRHTEIKTLITW